MSTSTAPIRAESRSSSTSHDTLAPVSNQNSDASQGIMAPTPRSTPGRKDTDVILSYYQSEDAGQAYTAEHAQTTKIKPPVYHRRMSTTSSPSEYSPDTDEDTQSKLFQPAATQKPKASSKVSKRPNTPSEVGSDRRRLAVVDMDLGSGDQAQGGSAVRKNSTRSKRGTDRLALVAPPDASPKTYTNLTLPSTAPLIAEKAYLEAQDHSSAGHHRASSEAVSSTAGKLRHGRKSSRNIGIVGTSGSLTTADPSQRQDPLPPIFQVPQSRSPSPKALSSFSDAHSSLHRGRSLKEDYLSTMSILSPQEVITPGIGEEIDVNDRVASPIVVSLTPPTPHTPPPIRSQSPKKMLRRKASPETISASPYPSPPFTPETPSSYLHYQPGVHATAGPLPPPPRAIFTPGSPSPPPRPPRVNSPALSRRRGDVSSVKQALQLPESTTGSLKSKTSSASFSDIRSNSSKSNISEAIYPQSSPKSAPGGELPPVPMSAHVREGAFQPSTESLSPIVVQSPRESMDDLAVVVGNATDDLDLVKTNDLPPPTVIEPPPRSSVDSDVRSGHSVKSDGWVSITPEDIPRVLTPNSDEGMSADSSHIHVNIFRRSISRSPPKAAKEVVDEVSPPSTPRHLRSTLTVNLKRFSSLPRAPSRWSEKRLSTSSRSSVGSSLSTLPPPPEVPELPPTPPPIRRIISPWPACMSYADVISKKTSLERSIGYANKINELYIHDCGLGEFLVETQYRGNNSRSKRATLVPSGPRGPSTASNNFRPRHISRSSMASEMTFPRRADTTTATDLSYRSKEDLSPPLGPPPLPYPSLAQSTPSAASRTSTITPSLSSSSSAQTIASPTSSGKSSSGFFSSLGRKASMKKDRGAQLNAQPSTKLQKASAKVVPVPVPAPRPVNIPSVPMVPGGPRAAPNRLGRSQTIMLAKSPTSSSSAASHRSASINRRPSLFTGRRQSPADAAADDQPVVDQDPEFVSQVAKLSDLLPNADKKVLAAYLRRAGSDLIAIGQYLEDQKNGTIRRD